MRLVSISDRPLRQGLGQFLLQCIDAVCDREGNFTLRITMDVVTVKCCVNMQPSELLGFEIRVAGCKGADSYSSVFAFISNNNMYVRQIAY